MSFDPAFAGEGTGVTPDVLTLKVSVIEPTIGTFVTVINYPDVVGAKVSLVEPSVSIANLPAPNVIAGKFTVQEPTVVLPEASPTPDVITGTLTGSWMSGSRT